MDVASTQIGNEEQAKTGSLSRGGFFVPRLGLRAKQVALLALLVATIVAVITIANIAYLTGSLVSRTRDQASQMANQIAYAIQQDIEQTDVDALKEDTLIAVASNRNAGTGTRRLMEAQITTVGLISYLYITNDDGQMVMDRDGENALAANTYLIGDTASARPDLEALAGENGYVQLIRLYGSEPFYEYRKGLRTAGMPTGTLHIGYSTSVIRKELFWPIMTNILIGLIAVLGAAVVAGLSANVLLRPLEVISSSIEKLENEPEAVDHENLPHDDMVTGVAARLRQLGARLADERSELEIMRGRLRQVIGHLEDRLLLINREGRVILASPDAEQILGMRNELTGLPIDETLGINHPLLNLIERAFSERRTIQRTILHVPDERKGRQILASVQYIEDGGVTIGALVTLRDYESFKKFESQWDVSKKLADLGRITSGIAHEVKNPLNAMVIHLEILRSKIETGAADPAPQIEILDSEIRRLDRVVQTFLNFTRPVEVRLEPLDLNRVVNQVVALAATEAAERGVTINRDLAPGELMVKGDADLLKQALLNVIINGCQAMPEGGPLRVATVRDENEVAKILISDRGIGIPEEARDRIFNLYYTTRQGGTGIGLAQAFRALQLHNGSIRLDSEVGIGTTFEISLPAMP